MNNMNMNNNPFSNMIIPNMSKEEIMNQMTKKPLNKNENYIVIDSRDRNTNKFTNISDYRIDLEQKYRKCCKIELVFAFIPDSQYIINNTNNKLHYTDKITNNNIITTDSSKIYEIDLPSGNYTSFITSSSIEQYDIDSSNSKVRDKLAKELETKLNTHLQQKNFSSASPGVEVTYDINTDKYTIEAKNLSKDIGFIFKGDEDYLYGINRDKVNTYRKNTIAPVLGFDKDNYLLTPTSGSKVTLVAPNRKDFYRNKYAVLTLKNLDFDRLQSINTNIDDSFAILPITGNCSKSKQPWPDEKRFSFEFVNKYPDINNLDIMFTDYDGNLIDFNGHNHLLIFCITTLNNNNLIDI